jgi:hypothetical protein|tara:strand:+ start:578 stop:862 length:285 start_codon:yes stop_codon:yes gene_type:complete
MKTITLEFEDLEWQILEEGIVDPTEWIQNVANVKMEKVRNRIVAKEQSRLIEGSSTTMPATIEGLVDSFFSQPDYLTAAERAAAANDDPALSDA